MQRLIILRGAPASGKSTIAKRLRNFKSKIIWLKVDNFKTFFADDASAALPYVNAMAIHSLNYLLDQGFSVIMEGIFQDPKYITLATQIAKDKNIPFNVFELKCSLTTLQKRDKTRPGVKEGCRKPLGNKTIALLNRIIKKNPWEGAEQLNTEELDLEGCVMRLGKKLGVQPSDRNLDHKRPRKERGGKRQDKQTKIAFFGTPTFAVVILEDLIGFCRTSDFEVAVVVTRPDKPAGRGMKPKASPVRILARQHHLPVVDTPKMEEVVNRMHEVEPDLIVLAAYMRLLPGKLLDLPRFGGLNVHPSLLPKYAGLSPIQHAILAGEKKTGVSVILMNEKYDQGGIIAQKETAILPGERRRELENRLAHLGGKLLIKTIPDWVRGEITPHPQDLAALKKYYTKKIKREDGFVAWKNFLKVVKGQTPGQAEKICRMMRAFDPWPGVWTKIADRGKGTKKRLKILDGTCEKGRLVVKTVQLEGKRPISWPEFVRGYGQALNV